MAMDVLDVPRARRACGRQHVRDRDQGESAEATRRVDLGVDPAAWIPSVAHRFRSTERSAMGRVGIEPTTLRLRVSCSAN